MININVERVDNEIGFLAIDSFGNKLKMDAAAEFGGNNNGIRPMQTLLMALAGCSGIDIVNILKKQKQSIAIFKIQVQGEREPNKEPSLWKNVHINFQFSAEVDIEKAKKACTLSIEKYCSVAATLRAAGCLITFNVETILNEI